MKSIQEFYRNRYTDPQRAQNSESDLERILTKLKPLASSPTRVLDFGCNTGTAAKFLTELDCNAPQKVTTSVSSQTGPSENFSKKVDSK